MTTARRLSWNFGLQHAVDHANRLDRPLLILEALRCDYEWASDRLHQFVLDGMAANRRESQATQAYYFPYVEPAPRHGRGLIRALSAQACVIVTDSYPAFFLPRMLTAAAAQSRVRVEAVDSNVIIPTAVHGRAFTVARAYRAFVQRELREHLTDVPDPSPLAALRCAFTDHRAIQDVLTRWPPADDAMLRGGAALAALPIDHRVTAVEMHGGAPAGREALRIFVAGKLPRYADRHNDPDEDCTSRLSPYLHFGHLSAHEIFSAVMSREKWTSRRLARRGGGAREGWWGVSPSAEVFLDQLVVWRELSFNGCAWIPDYTRYESLPAWARQTLLEHAGDERRQYDLDTLERAGTHDEVWNAAQRQLVRDGWFHSYLRMLWGKKILEWSPDPQSALDRMEVLMNRYSLDGRDPNSWAGFTWVLGRYDRPWPERDIFGTVRTMTSDSAKRKLRMKRFLVEYGPRS